jgi:hypothetical protein
MITLPSNAEGTNDMMNSSRGSRTPPWLHHVGPTMAARARPKPSSRQFEDLSRCFSFASAALWWMDGCGSRPRSNGIMNRAQNRPSWPAWADWPRPVSAPSHSPILLGQLLTCSLLHVGPWHCLLHDLDIAPCLVRFNIFCSGPWILRLHASVPGPFGVMFIMCLDLCWALWSSLEVLGELILKVSSLTLVSHVNNKLQNGHSRVNMIPSGG